MKLTRKQKGNCQPDPDGVIHNRLPSFSTGTNYDRWIAKPGMEEGVSAYESSLGGGRDVSERIAQHL